MITIVDYGVGNLFSLYSSLQYIGADVEFSTDAEKIRRADKLILPGVGAFRDAAEKLRESGLEDALLDAAEKGTPLLGICLGMQLLFETSFEYGQHRGLGLLRGSVLPLEGHIPASLKIPHIGWNALHFHKKHPLFRFINEGDCVYFVHSFFAAPEDDSLLATAEYGKEITAAVAQGNIMGCQFHPEKSGDVGLRILRAFCESEE